MVLGFCFLLISGFYSFNENHISYHNSLATSVISYRDYSTEDTNCPPAYIPWNSGQVLKCKVSRELETLVKLQVNGIETTADPIILDKLGFK